jgi:hypothetical protein
MYYTGNVWPYWHPECGCVGPIPMSCYDAEVMFYSLRKVDGPMLGVKTTKWYDEYPRHAMPLVLMIDDDIAR